MGDLSGGMLAALAMAIGLFHRERAGEGCYLDIAMLDGLVSWLTIHAATFFATGQVPRRGGMRLSGGLPGYHVYETKDGRYVTVGALEEKFWRNLCRALGCEDMAAEPAPTGRALEDAQARLRRIFREKTRAEWVALLGEAEVCFAPVLDLDEALTDPQVLHRRMVLEMEGPEAGKVRVLGNPIKSSLEEREAWQAPRLGEHTAEILQGLGYSPEEVERFRREGVAGG